MLVRVSCTSLALLQCEDGRIALLIDRAHLKATGETVVKPPGGVIEVKQKTALELRRRFGAEFEGPVGQHTALRLRVEELALGLFRQNLPGWDEQPKLKGRLREGLVETGVLTKQCFQSTRWQLERLGFGEQLTESRHSREVNEVWIAAIWEVVTPSAEVYDILRRMDQQVKSPLVLVTPEEVLRGITSAGVIIDPVARLLFNFHSKL